METLTPQGFLAFREAARHQDAAGAAPAATKKSNGPGRFLRVWSWGGQRADGGGAAKPVSGTD